MDKILDGASKSHFLDLKFKDILTQQRLI